MPAHAGAAKGTSPWRHTLDERIGTSRSSPGCPRGIAACLLAPAVPASAQDEILVLGGEGRHCGEDPACINRLHPPRFPWRPAHSRGRPSSSGSATPSDFDLDPASTYDDPREGDAQIGTVHPLTGPVHIEGAEPGDVLAVTLLDIAPGRFGYTSVSPIGFVSDHVTGVVPRGVAPRPHRGDQRRRAGRAHPQCQLPRHPHRAARPRAARDDAVARGRAARPRGAGFPPHALHASPAARLRPERISCRRVPAHPPPARARRQPRHPLSAGRRHRVPAVLRRRLRPRHRRPALRAGRRRGVGDRDSRWTPTSR